MSGLRGGERRGRRSLAATTARQPDLMDRPRQSTQVVRALLHARAAAALSSDGGGGGTLLHGPPGCGKTMLARGLGPALGVPTTWLSVPGGGAAASEVAAAVRGARAAAPCLLVLDELQALAPARTLAGSADERRALQLAEAVQALRQEGARVFVLGVCRAPHEVHPALRRAGRLHHQLAIHAPG